MGISKGWPVIQWRQVWINDSNTEALAAHIVDPLDPRTEYIENSLSCEARGISHTDVCRYDAAQHRIEWWGTIGADPGAKDEASAQNEVVITYRVRVTDPTMTSVQNQANLYWDANGDHKVDPQDENVSTGTPVEKNAQVYKEVLPHTGFAIRTGAANSSFAEPQHRSVKSDLWLEIPRLGVRAPILGVSREGETWDVNWLWTQVGWLRGTAFPTHRGNSVLAAHVTLASGRPGPFAELHRLHEGDRVILWAWGHPYTYVVRRVFRVTPDDERVLLPKPGTWLTLLTCDEYDPRGQTYLRRLVVQAESATTGRPAVSYQNRIPIR